MNIYIVIPAHNEENLIGQMLDSLINQTLVPKKIVVVNDNSSDATKTIVELYTKKHSFISIVNTQASSVHMPGNKVINAFYQGFNTLDENYDIICKFDADLVFPPSYLKKISENFIKNPKTGMVSGLLYIQKNNDWVYERIADKTHIRGPIKAYRKECFTDINGLRKSIGWDTVDVLLSQFHGWKTETIPDLIVKHLKPTGKQYHKNSKYLQGEAMYKMRYGFLITLIAAAKLAVLKKHPQLITNYMIGFFKAQRQNIPFLVSIEEGVFIRKLRWSRILKKVF